MSLDSQPEHSAANGNHRRVIAQRFFVARGEAAGLFEQVECAFHRRARFVELLVERGGRFAISFRWDDRDGIASCEVLADRIGIVGLVGQQAIGIYRSNERGRILTVMSIPSRYFEFNG